MGERNKQKQSIPGRNGGTLRPFASGVSGNPRGRPAGGLTIIEHWNAIVDAMERGTMTRHDLDHIIESDPNGNRAMAAASYKRALNPAYFNATPLAANDLDRILDRTVGKPTQRVEVQEVKSDPAEVMREIVSLLDAHPELRMVIDTTAIPLPLDADTTTQPDDRVTSVAGGEYCSPSTG